MAFYDDFKKYEGRTALLNDKGEALSYGEMEKLCRKMGAALEERALLFAFCENSIGSVLGYVSCLYHHVIPVLLDCHMERALWENLILLYRPEYLYLPEAMYDEFEGISCVWRGYGYCLCATGKHATEALYPQLALLLTTSGSTGSPKLVRQSYQNIQANAASIVEYLAIDETERPITTLPMNYTYGLSIINSHLLAGATILLTDASLMDRRFWDFFKSARATSFGGVPYTYEILNKLRFFNMELPSLRTMTQAGGKLSVELHRAFARYAQENGKRFVVMYGQCEATARMAYLPPEQSLEKCGSMGIPIPGGRLELVDVAGNEISQADTVGELVYYGENVTLGYAQQRADLAKGDERFGRLETGDMAKRDADGYYYIVGRKKRFLKIYGNRVNLDETEQMVKAFLKEGDCACGGQDDQLCVYLTEDLQGRQEDVKRFLAEKTGLHPSSFAVRFLDKIPKNEAGKTLYAQLDKDKV